VSATKQREYEITGDSSGRFSAGDIITNSQYNSMKEEYEIRLKDWDGNAESGDAGAFHISGRKRDLIKSFLEEKRYALTSEYFHYTVRARGKKIDPDAILLKLKELGLKYLWVRVRDETGPERPPRRMRPV
jgi:hypothetical protein